MSAASDSQPVEGARADGPSDDFAAYCRTEIERRRNSGEPFDEEGFQEVVAMVLRRLQGMEDEGWS